MVLVRTLSSPKNRGERSWGNWAPLLADRARASKTAKWVQTEKKMSCPVVLVILPRDLSFPRRFVCLFVSEILQFWSQQLQVVSNCSSFFCFSLFIYLFIYWNCSKLCSFLMTAMALVMPLFLEGYGQVCSFNHNWKILPFYLLLLFFLNIEINILNLKLCGVFVSFFSYSNLPFCLWRLRLWSTVSNLYHGFSVKYPIFFFVFLFFCLVILD